jgi:membrane associated rhomboid family serine protease
MLVSYILIGANALIFLMYNNQEFKNRFMFNAYAIKHRNEWWRWFTGGFLHADGGHILFNMLTLFFFGPFIESVFTDPHLFGPVKGSIMFLLMYLSAIPVSSAYSFFKNKNNPYYNALGASGAVSAVVYAFILFQPVKDLYIFFSIPIPAWIYGILYLVISWTLARRKVGTIGHDAHFFGSVYGFIFPIVFFPFLAENFISQLVQALTS